MSKAPATSLPGPFCFKTTYLLKNVGTDVGTQQKQPDIIWLFFNNLEANSSDPAGTRTQDPYIKSVLLYQLSYKIVSSSYC